MNSGAQLERTNCDIPTRVEHWASLSDAEKHQFAIDALESILSLRHVVAGQHIQLGRFEIVCKLAGRQLDDAMNAVIEAIDLMDAGSVQAARDRLDAYTFDQGDFN